MLISKFDLYKAEWLDLVFDNRNKNYGAYELRRHYGRNMSKAIAITVFAFVGTAFALSLVASHKTKESSTDTLVVVDLTHVKPVKPPKEQVYKTQPQQVHKSLPHTTPAAAAPVKTIAVPVMRPSDQGTAEPPKITQIEKAAIGPETLNGKEGAVNLPPTSGNGSGNGSTAAQSTGTDILPIAEVSPEPLGGAAAWSRFLQKNLRYPVIARENGVQGKVIVSFVVEKDGHLSDIKVIRGIGSGCDEEAVRVLKLAPAWKPGMQNGQPVRVQYTIPMNFQLAEE